MNDWKFIILIAFLSPLFLPFKQIFVSCKLTDFNLNSIQDLFQNSTNLLSNHPACKEEILSLCGKDLKVLQNNLEIINCISESEDADKQLSLQCQNQIWMFKHAVTNLKHFAEITKTVCKSLLVENSDCLNAENEEVLNPGANLLSCLIDRIQHETEDRCKVYLKQMELMIFGDYRLVHKFTDVCEPYIKKFQCGRLDGESNPHSQTNTISCLQLHLGQVSPLCQHEILRVSELQSNDFHLDKPLYFSCRMDRERFCANIKSGNGRIYKCLMKNINEPELSEECKNKLVQREQLIVQDYKISKSLVQSCKWDIRTYQCRHNTSDRKEIRLAQMLLCLENVHAKGLSLSTDCQSEMLLHRRFLFENYKLTPNLVSSCQHDIDDFCHYVEFGAKILHCLMKYAKAKRRRGDDHTRRRVSTICQRELEILLKEVNIAEDWRVDPVLQENCQSTVEALCEHVHPGNGRVLSCLAEHIDSNQMLEKCRETLNQMQYFVVRNFELDTEVYSACHEDAVKNCHAKPNWHDDNNLSNMDPERGPTVMACLYRYAYHRDDSIRLQPNCIQQIKRVMKNRASNVDLLPFIEEPCMQDLAQHCSSSDTIDQKGYEMECLQNNYQILNRLCRAAIGNFTEAQGSSFELNYPLFKSCLVVVKELCQIQYEHIESNSDGEVIQCLIQYKNHYLLKKYPKCRTSIEHFQLINSKDFRFDSKFKHACKSDIKFYCSNLHTKYDVVNCLAALVYNDSTTKQQRPRVSTDCRDVLRAELLQFDENLQLDQGLTEACHHDRQQHCVDMDFGESRVLECLKTNIHRLTKACQRRLFRKLHIELADNSVDYSLMSLCKNAIQNYCISADLQDVLYCLRDHLNNPGINRNCRSLITKRLKQQNLDYRLNPRLKSGCATDINRHCSNIIAKAKPEELLDGKVIACLKAQYLHNTLSQTCEIEIINVIREISMNIELDPILYKNCQKEINEKCMNELDIHECLKKKFLLKKIDDTQCKKEVARLIKETEADIESDPHLFQVCVADLKTFCADIVAGHGHQWNCLVTVHRNSPNRLSQECGTVLQKRLQLFEYAAEVDPPDSMVQVFRIVSDSPSHNYFYTVFILLILFFFFGGALFGRVYQPVPVSDKMK